MTSHGPERSLPQPTRSGSKIRLEYQAFTFAKRMGSA